MSTTIRGHFSELKFQIWAMEQNIDIALPPSCTNYVWDLLIYYDGGWKSVQVKTIRYDRNRDGLRSELDRVNNTPYAVTDCDYFVFCDIETNELFLFKSEELENPNNPGYIIRDFTVYPKSKKKDIIERYRWFRNHKL